MVPDRQVIVIAHFSLEDLRRLHTLLVCYESPFTGPDETMVRQRDKDEHERLRRRIALLLTEHSESLGRDDSREGDEAMMGNDA